MSDTIVQQIVLTGDSDVLSALNGIAAGYERLQEAADKIGKSGGGLADVGSGLSGLHSTINETGAAAEGASGHTYNFVTMLRYLGRASHVPELSQLSSALRLFGSAAAGIPVIIAAIATGFGAMANSAANAADKMQTTAAKLGMSAQSYQEATAAGAAFGVSADKMATSLEAVDKAIKSSNNLMTDQNAAVDKATQALSDYQAKARSTSQPSAFDDAAQKRIDAISDSVQALGSREADLRYSYQRASDAGKDALKTSQQIAQHNLETEKQRLQNDLNQAQRDKAAGDRARQSSQRSAQTLQEVRELERARDEAAKADEKRPLAKVGINLAGVKDAQQGMYVIADALKAMGDGALRAAAEQELIAIGIDRRVIPALERGAAAYRLYEKEGLNLRPPFSGAELKGFDALIGAFTLFGNALGAIKDRLAVLATPALTEMFTSMAEVITANRNGIVEFASAIGRVLLPVLQGIGVIITSVVIPVFNQIKAAFDDVAKQLNSVFGTNLTGMDLLVGVIFARILLSIGSISGGISDVANGVFTLGAAFTAFSPVALGAIGSVIVALAPFLPAIIAIGAAIAAMIIYWPQFSAAGIATINAVLGGWDSFKQAVLAVWDAIVGYISERINAIVKFIDNLISKAKEGLAALGKLLGVGGGEANPTSGEQTYAEGYARGGLPRRRGGNSDDRILGWFAPDEFIMRGAVLRRYGKGFLDAINNLSFPAFAMGGLAGVLPGSIMPQPAMAVAGSSPRQIFNLHIGGEQFDGMTAPDATAARLIQYAVRKQVKSAGRKPSWVR